MANPIFNAPLTNPFGLSDVGNIIVPTLVDIDHDGDLDVFVGESSGNSYYFQNIGSATNPTFSTAQINPFGLSYFGQFPWLRPSPTSTTMAIRTPLLALETAICAISKIPARPLRRYLPPMAPTPSVSLVSAHSAMPDFADIDHDGDLDVFVGDDDGIVRYFQNTGTAASPHLYRRRPPIPSV